MASVDMRGGPAAPLVPVRPGDGLRVLAGRVAPPLVAVLLFLLLASPIFPILYQAFIDRPLYEADPHFTLANFSNLVSNSDFLSALANTCWFVLLATAISTVVGLLVGLAVDRLQLPFRRGLKIAFLSPLFVSPLILAFAWSMLYGPGGYATLLFRTSFGIGIPNLNSIIGMSIVAGVSQAPISYLFCAGAIANIPVALENSARSAGAGPLRIVWDIVLPLLTPSILFCALLNAIVTLDLLAVPLIIGEPARIQVLASFLYTNGVLAAKVDYGIVATTAIFLLIFIQLFVAAQTRLIGDTRRFATVGGRGGHAPRADVGRAAWVIWGLLMLYALITSIIPCLFLVLRSFTSFLSPMIPVERVLTLDNFRLIFSYEAYIRSITNTVIIAVGGSLGAVLLTCIAAVVAYRTTSRMRVVIEQISFIPRAIPGLVVGVGMFYTVIFLPYGGEIRHSLVILIAAFTIRYFPTGFAALGPAFFQIGADLERAVRSAGGSWLRAMWDVTLPLLRKALIACFLIYFVHFFKEYSAASFLFGPGTEVIGTTMLQLNLMGNLGSVAALSVVQLALTVPVAIVVYARD